MYVLIKDEAERLALIAEAEKLGLSLEQYIRKLFRNDGPEDNRAGTERNLVDCFRAIDDWHEDNA